MILYIPLTSVRRVNKKLTCQFEIRLWSITKLPISVCNHADENVSTVFFESFKKEISGFPHATNPILPALSTSSRAQLSNFPFEPLHRLKSCQNCLRTMFISHRSEVLPELSQLS